MDIVPSTPWKTIRWMRTTAESLTPAEPEEQGIETSDPSGTPPATTAATTVEWTYEFKPEEALLHELRKKIQLYEVGQQQTSGQVSTWEYYKKVVNPYELVYTQKKYEDFPESVCIQQPLSRSYFKILEVLSITDFLTDVKPSQRLCSAHVCEGPGGFIQGFLEECSRRRLNVGVSTAITLKPTQQNVPGWKRAAHFLQKNKQVRVVYGKDGTGDLLSYENQNDFIRSVPNKVHFFTGDGGFDFSTDYDSQEKTIFPLLVASVRTGFEVLAPGGVFVLKFFDLYYDGTKDLICFLSKCFRRWTLYKPATSRPCNPEIYFLGDRFLPPPPPVMETLRTWCKEQEIRKQPPRRLLAALPVSFSLTIDSFLRDSVTLQTEYLRKVFHLIETPRTKEEQAVHIRDLLKRHEVISYDWCRAFNAPVYPQRVRLIAASRKCLQESGQLG